MPGLWLTSPSALRVLLPSELAVKELFVRFEPGSSSTLWIDLHSTPADVRGYSMLCDVSRVRLP